ncbi:MAG: fold, partial [Gaiellales bacterium]|nr:fold [Gaiellales bacterium]
MRELSGLRAVADLGVPASSVDDTHGVFDASFSVNSRGRVTLWNELAEKMFGWTAHEAVGSPLAELIVPA